jgi:hypothetical protein
LHNRLNSFPSSIERISANANHWSS